MPVISKLGNNCFSSRSVSSGNQFIILPLDCPFSLNIRLFSRLHLYCICRRELRKLGWRRALHEAIAKFIAFFFLFFFSFFFLDNNEHGAKWPTPAQIFHYANYNCRYYFSAQPFAMTIKNVEHFNLLLAWPLTIFCVLFSGPEVVTKSLQMDIVGRFGRSIRAAQRTKKTIESIHFLSGDRKLEIICATSGQGSRLKMPIEWSSGRPVGLLSIACHEQEKERERRTQLARWTPLPGKGCGKQ